MMQEHFVVKPEPLYTTQYPDLFVTYIDGFDMNTGKPRPYTTVDNEISGRLILDSTKQRYMFACFKHLK